MLSITPPEPALKELLAEYLVSMPNPLSLYAGLQALAHYGLNIDHWSNDCGQSALHIACEEGILEIVEAVVAMKADVNRKCEEQGYTPLCYASQNGHTKIVAYLLAHGAVVDDRQLLQADKNTLSSSCSGGGEFALHEAAYRGHADTVRLLIAAGADVSKEDEDGFTPARECCLGYLPSWRSDKRRQLDVRTGKAEALRLIFESGGDVTGVDSQGWTLLHRAAENGLKECVTLLVEKGLQVNCLTDSNSDGVRANPYYQFTSLHAAARNGKDGAIRELVRLGADLEAVDSKGRTALFDAAASRVPDGIAALISLGASAKAIDPLGLSPLHVAAAFGRMRAAYLLVEAGADVNALTHGDHSPLMTCFEPEGLTILDKKYGTVYGSVEDRAKVAQFLLEMGAEITCGLMRCAVEGGMTQIILKRVRQLTEMNEAKDAKFAGVGNALVADQGKVVTVKLLNRISGAEAAHSYQLNTQLVKLLAGRQVCEKDKGGGGGGGEGVAAGCDAGRLPPASGSVMSKLLEPGKYGFKEGDAACGVMEVKLEFDGSDFTEAGFAAAVMYLTTGSVEGMLVSRKRRRRTMKDEEGGEDDEYGGTHGCSDSGGGGGDGIGGGAGFGGIGGGGRRSSSGNSGGNGGCNGGGGGSSSGGVGGGSSGDGIGGYNGGSGSGGGNHCLFNAEKAAKALQAAQFFCLEGMTEEVQRLANVYGFEYDDR